MRGIGAAALVVVDMQNDFVRAGAPFEVPEARRAIPSIAGLIALFRGQAGPVVYTRYIADRLYRPLAPRLAWLGFLDPPISACVPGVRRRYGDVAGEREGVAIIDELRPEAGDMVLDKIFYSAFHGTDLGARLDRYRVRSLVVTGTVAEMCVEDTARHAVHFGYAATIVKDAVASRSPDGERWALEGFGRNYGWVSDVGGTVAALMAEPG